MLTRYINLRLLTYMGRMSWSNGHVWQTSGEQRPSLINTSTAHTYTFKFYSLDRQACLHQLLHWYWPWSAQSTHAQSANDAGWCTEHYKCRIMLNLIQSCVAFCLHFMVFAFSTLIMNSEDYWPYIIHYKCNCVLLEKLLVVLRDGRTLIGFLRSIDQFGKTFGTRFSELDEWYFYSIGICAVLMPLGKYRN